MTSTTHRIITIALAALALAAPAATAMPTHDTPGTAAPVQDQRLGVAPGVLERANGPRALQEWAHSLRNFDQRVAAARTRQPSTTKPVVKNQPASLDTVNGRSPLIYILPSLALAAIVATAYARIRHRSPA